MDRSPNVAVVYRTTGGCQPEIDTQGKMGECGKVSKWNKNEERQPKGMKFRFDVCASYHCNHFLGFFGFFPFLFFFAFPFVLFHMSRLPEGESKSLESHRWCPWRAANEMQLTMAAVQLHQRLPFKDKILKGSCDRLLIYGRDIG